MRYFYFTITFFLLCFSNSVFSQLSNVHYLPPLKQSASNNNGVQNGLDFQSSQAIVQQAIYLSAPPESGNITVNIYRGTSLIPWLSVPVSNTNPYTIDATDGLANSDNNITLVTNRNTGEVLTNSGLRFESTGKFYVNYRGRSGSQAGSLTCKGEKALGKDFRWGGIPNKGTTERMSTSLGIMATVNGTIVTVSGYDTNCAFRQGADPNGITSDVITRTLNAGETFVLEAIRNPSLSDITAAEDTANIAGWFGATITSTEPIAIANGGLNVGLKSNSGGRDVGIDQPVPTNVLGREYVFIRGNGDFNDGSEFPIIVATKDDTDVFVGGVWFGNINNGEYLEIIERDDNENIVTDYYSGTSAGDNLYVRTSKDAYAFQCLAGQTNRFWTLGMNFIAPVNCLLPEVLSEVPQIHRIAGEDSNISALTIVASALTADADVQVFQNGILVPNGGNSAISGTSDWKTFYVDNNGAGLSGEISVQSSGQIAVGTFMALGNAAGLAGYFSGFDTVPVVEVEITGGGCHPGSNLQEVTGGFDNYAWYKGFDEITGTLLASGPGPTFQTYDPTINGIGDYFVRVTDGTCEYNSAVVSFYSCDPELQVIKTDNLDATNTINAGSEVTFTVTAESFSVDPITNVTIEDTLPPELEFVSATPETGTTFDNTTLTWNIGGMDPGDKVELQIVARAKDDASGTVTNTVAYDYDEIATEINSLADDLTEDVIINPCMTAGDASSTPSVCINTALTAITHATTIATGIGTITGLPAGVSASWASNEITISGTPTASGTFNYSIELTGGCNAPVNATGTITVNALPIANDITGTNVVCVNGTVNLTEDPSVFGGTITWNSSNTGVATIDSSGEVTGVSSGSTDITYTVTDGNGCTSLASNAFTVTVNPLPVFTSVTTNTPICEGEDAEFYISGSPNAELTYSLNSGINETTTLDASGDATIVLSVAASDVTIDLISLENLTTGCSIPLTNSETVTVNPNPTLASVSDIIVCDDNSGTQELDANDAITLNPNTSVVWYDVVTGGNTVTNPIVNTLTPSTDPPTSYFAEITDTSSSCVNPVRVEVKLQIVSPPFPDLVEEVCSNEALNIGLSFATTYTVSSSDPTNVPPGASRTTAAVANITDTYINTTAVPVDITYEVTIADGSACDGEVFDIVVTVYPESDGGTISADQIICSGDTPADISLSNVIGDIVNWQSSTSVTFSSFTNIAETSITLAGATIGSLTQTTYYRAVVQSGPCTTTNSPIVTVNVDLTNPVVTGTLPNITEEGCLASDAPTPVSNVSELEALGLTISDDFTLDVDLSVSSSDTSVGATCTGDLQVTRTYTVSDSCGNETDLVQTITVEDTIAPTGTAPMDITGLECITDVPVADITLITDEADNCGGAVTVTVADTDNGGSGCNGDPYIVTRTYTLEDCGGLTTDLVQRITVEDTLPPTGTAPMDITGLECITDVPVADITLITDEADNCGGAVIVTVADTDNGGSGCNGDPYIVTRTYTLEDCGGLTTDLVQTITVEDTLPPTGTAPMDITGLECITDVPVADITLITDEADNCGGAVTVTVSDTDNGGSGCNGDPYIVTRTYTLEDCGGLTTDLVQTITVENVTAPIVPADDGSTVTSIDDAVQPTAPIVEDTCGNTVAPVITENASPLCDGEKIYTFTYTDCGGNVSVYTYIYTIDVTSTLEIADTTATNCSDVALNYDLTNLTTLTGVTFDWVVTPNANITGAADGNGTILNDVITNISGTPQDVLYTITPYNSDNCMGNTFELLVTINPEPFNAIAPTDITCSNVVVTHDLTTDVDLAGTIFSWVAADNPNVSGETTTPAFGTTIADTLINTSGAVQTVTYTITPTSAANCVGDVYEYIVTVSPEAEVVVEKIALAAVDGSYDSVGEVIQYEITVENTSEVELSNMILTDANADTGSISPATGVTIPSLGSVTFTASHTITQADLDAGQVINGAEINGEDPCGNAISETSDDPSTTNPNDDTVVTLDQSPSISLLKTATFNDENGDGIPQENETLTYNFTVENTGNVTVTDISITDPLVTVTGGAIDLAPTEIDATTFTATYIITQANIDSGSLTNSATATGTDPNGDSVTDTSDDPNDATDDDPNGDGEPDDATVFEFDEAPELTVYKTGVFIDANGDGFAQVGETINYTFDVINTGNVTISNITISDPVVSVSGSAITLAPTENDSTTFTAVYTLTQADVDAGSVTNTATASGESPVGTTITDDSDDPTTTGNDDPTITTLSQDPQLTLLKTSVFNDENGNGFPEVGETITYNFDIRNTGNVTITNISITDPLVTVNGGPIDLKPSETDTTTFTAIYTITLANINAGGVSNSATAEGEDPNGDSVSDISDDPNDNTNADVDGDGNPDDETFTTLEANPQLSIEKIGVFADENADGITQVGETINYTFNIINTGNVTVSNITVSDALVTVSGSAISLDPTENDDTTFTATYTITQADIDLGSITNSATATGEDPSGNPVSDTSDDPNDTTDDDPNGDGEPDDDTITTLPVEGGISLTKATLPAADGSYDTLGEAINYELIVTNTGNVTLTNIVVTDANADSGSITPATIASLVPGATVTVNAVHTITQDDLNVGEVNNTASVSGEDPFGNSVEDTSDDPSDTTDNDTDGDGDPDDVTNTLIEQLPSMELEKVSVFNDENGDGIPQLGETLTYNFSVENTGNVIISNISITDPLVAVNGGPINLAPGEVNNNTFYAVYTITQANIDAGSITNSATVNGEDPSGNNVTDTSDDPNDTTNNDANGDGDPDDATITTLARDPQLTIAKTGVFIDTNGDGLAQVGETIQYIFDVSNTGNVTISNITVSDPLVSVSGSAITLIPGQTDSTTFTATYSLTQADVDNGSVENQATATGEDPSGGSVTDTSDDPTTADPDDSTITTLARDPQLSLFKIPTFNDENGDGIPQAGETISYVFDVRNTGNVTIFDVVVTDPIVTVSGSAIDLAPAQVDNTTFSAVYFIKQSDIDAGNLTNTALVEGEDVDGGTITDVSDFSDDPDNPINEDLNGDGDPDDPTVTTLKGNPELNLDKIGTFNDENGDGIAQVGETISYAFEVNNTGNMTITDITINDPLVSVSGGPIDLLPTQMDTTTFTAVYTISQFDIDSGGVTNSAAASGQDPNGNTISDNSDDPNNAANVDDNNDGNPDDDTLTTLPFTGSINITKETLAAFDGSYDTLGEQITYEIMVTNTGNVTLTDIEILDANADVGSITPANVTILLPGESVTAFAAHTITQADLDAGSVSNIASAEATDPFGSTVSDDSDDPNNTTDNDPDGDGNPDDITVTLIDQSPSISLNKIGIFNDENGDGFANEGETIRYIFEVINTGNVTVSDITISDNLVAVSGAPITLIPNQRDATTFAAIYTITQTDVDAGQFSNLATTEGEDPNGNSVIDTSDDPNNATNNDVDGDGDPDDTTVTILPGSPSISLLKESVFNDEDGNGLADAGETITYSFTITNTGTVTVSNISITDPLVSVSGGPIELVPNEIDNSTFTAIYTLTQTDVDSAGVSNSAVAEGQDPFGNEVTDTSDDPNDNTNIDSDGNGDPDDATITNLPSNGQLDIIKEVEQTIYRIVGEVLNYTITVTNIGNVTLENVEITDPNAVITGPSTIDSLSPGEVFMTTAEHKIVQADINAEVVENVAFVTAGIINSTDVITEDSDDPNEDTNIDIDNDGDFDDPTYSFYDADGDEIPDALEPSNNIITADDLQIFNSFSPNGDNKNDIFIIKGFENTQNTVSIYNRWGVKVYETESYGSFGNFFRGYSSGRVTIEEGEKLPGGTYYYVIEYTTENDVKKQKIGFVYLNQG